jgi:hypothetical protein
MGLVVHTWDPSAWAAEQEHHEFEANLRIQWHPILRKTTKCLFRWGFSHVTEVTIDTVLILGGSVVWIQSFVLVMPWAMPPVFFSLWLFFRCRLAFFLGQLWTVLLLLSFQAAVQHVWTTTSCWELVLEMKCAAYFLSFFSWLGGIYLRCKVHLTYASQ